MQNLKVTLVQANQVWENKQANFSNYERLLAEVQNTDLIVLPEMFHTGFSMEVENLAEKMENGEGLTWLQTLAKQKNAAVYTSLIIEEKGSYFNRGVFVFPSGDIQIYDKRKRFALAGEDLVFTDGKSETIIDYLGWKINLQICYDLRFPEIARNELHGDKAKYDVLLYVANWPERRVHHWKSLLIARAIENQCYVVGVNRVGEDGKGLNYSGDSVIIDALGVNQSAIEAGTETIETIELNHENLLVIRKNLPFLQDI
jgi:omega-amidase